MHERPGAEPTAVPLTVNGHTVYLSVERLDGDSTSDEQEVAGRRPSLEQALDGLMGVADLIGDRLQQANTTRASVEFGCEFALESGSFVAVIGKVSTKSAFKVSLEWDKPIP